MVRPKFDPFGNVPTRPWEYYPYLSTPSRKPIFREITTTLSPDDAYVKRIRDKFTKKYIKPTQFAIFWTNVFVKRSNLFEISYLDCL